VMPKSWSFLMLCLVIKIKSFGWAPVISFISIGRPVIFICEARLYFQPSYNRHADVCSSPNFNQTRWYRSDWEFKYCYSPVNFFARLSDTAYSTYYVNHWMRSYAR
jgi:hypothetical protein